MLGVGLSAQDAADAGVSERPAETDIIFTDTEAPENAVVQDSADALPGIGFGDFARMILVLGVVIGLIYGFFWILKRFSGVKAQGEEAINLLATRPLKGDAALHLVEVGAHIYMVGSSSNAVNLIAELDDQESLDEIRLRSSQTMRPAPGGFAAMIRRRFGSTAFGAASDKSSGSSDTGSAGNPSPGSEKDPSEFVRRQRERLKDL